MHDDDGRAALGDQSGHVGDQLADSAVVSNEIRRRFEPSTADMNIANLDFKTTNWIVLAVSLLIGLGYVAVMKKLSAERTVPAMWLKWVYS